VDIETMSKRYGRNQKEFVKRTDGRIEWICEHGIGHTVWYPKNLSATHGCDGCCKKLNGVE